MTVKVYNTKHIFGKCTLLLLCIHTASMIYAEQLTRGEEALLQNNPSQSVPFLQQTIAENPKDGKAYLHLAFAYEQLSQYRDAVATLQEGVINSRDYINLLYNNLGNNFSALKEWNDAYRMYSEAIKTDHTFADAYLNRANTSLHIADASGGLGNKKTTAHNYTSAIDDYTRYLELNPTSSQQEQVRRMIALLQNSLVQEEQRQLELELQQQALLDSVLESLSNADDINELKSKTEDVLEISDELDIAE